MKDHFKIPKKFFWSFCPLFGFFLLLITITVIYFYGSDIHSRWLKVLCFLFLQIFIADHITSLPFEPQDKQKLAVFHSILITVLAILLNNLWHLIHFKNIFQSFDDYGTLSDYFYLLKADLLYTIGPWIQFRYIGCFLSQFGIYLTIEKLQKPKKDEA